jgi:hypothetical protein
MWEAVGGTIVIPSTSSLSPDFNAFSKLFANLGDGSIGFLFGVFMRLPFSFSW